MWSTSGFPEALFHNLTKLQMTDKAFFPPDFIVFSCFV
jgi:hypothetical protein